MPLTTKQKSAILGAGALAAATVGVIVKKSTSLPPCNFAPPAGALTDCGANGATYSLKPEIAVGGYGDIANGKLRWGSGYATGLPGGKCIVSEADNALPALYEQAHSCSGGLSWQDQQDMGLVLGLDKQIERDACNVSGPCTPANAYIITKDNDFTWSTGKAPAGSHPGDCPQFKPTEKPCNAPGTTQAAWNCFWGHAVYVSNQAPHCGGSAPPQPTVCKEDAEHLCLLGKRFRVSVAWSSANAGGTGTGKAIPMSADTGGFWFFQSSNYELLVKVLDGRSLNQKYWVFYGALSDVEYDITVVDTATSAVKTYHNAAGVMQSVGDTGAFPGSPSAALPPALEDDTVALAGAWSFEPSPLSTGVVTAEVRRP